MDTTTALESSRRLAALLAAEHRALGDFLVALAGFDRLRLWEPLGYSGLFPYLHRELGLSRAAAYYRLKASELVQRYPEVEAALRSGALCITTVAELAKVLDDENRAEVLPRFLHRSKAEAKELVAELRPLPVPRREVVKAVGRARGGSGAGDEVRPGELPLVAALPTPTPPGTPSSPPAHPEHRDGGASSREPPTPQHASTGPGPGPEPGPSGVAPTASGSARPQVVPLTADVSRLHLNVSRAFLVKLAAARDALAHSRPGATCEALLEAGLDLLLSRQATRRGLTTRPRKPAAGAAAPARITEVRPDEPPRARLDDPRRAEPTSPPRESAAAVQSTARTSADVPPRAPIPAHVRREVWLRDEGRCQWPLHAGGICGSTYRLELDHLVPAARGGPPAAANLRVLCERHNKLAARQAFGAPWMARFARGGGTEARPGAVAEEMGDQSR